MTNFDALISFFNHLFENIFVRNGFGDFSKH
jgi:hypothetical protein